MKFLDRIDIAGFTSETQSPWAADSEPFVISAELQELLQLEKNQVEAVQDILVDARETHMFAQWSSPTTIWQRGDAVVIEIDPAPAELGVSIRESLVSVMGERRAVFLVEKIAPTLDWEFGGFGRARRVIEVTVLPDDTISLRESLRRADPGGPDQLETGRQPIHEQFELRARQHRVDYLPEQIAALVRIEPADGRE